MKIPFVDLKLQYQNYKSEIDKAIADVITDTAFVGGSGNKYVVNFESQFANYLGVKHVISVANGTDSLEILLEAYDIGTGDEVIVPALSWISSSESIGRCGAKPVFIDVSDDSLLIDISLIEKAITSTTKAIMPVHLYGNAVNMEEVMRIANKYNLKVIEDCAQSHGARFKDKLTGTYGHAASFSFYPGKNLGAYGDAGAIATNDDIIAAKCRMIANHGQKKKHDHIMEGRNSRMDGIHASILSVKLNYLDSWNLARNRVADYYANKLDTTKVMLPVKSNNVYHAFHLYVIRTDKRDLLKEYLSSHGIESAIHYPTALPFLAAYKHLQYNPEHFPIAFRETNRILSLPMYPELSHTQLEYITNIINNF